jgi:hypothetical protein
MLDRVRPSAVLAVAAAVMVAAANAADLLMLGYFGAYLVLPYSLATFSAVGLIVALRRPGHPIGWLFLGVGTCLTLNFTIRAYAWRALVDAPGTLPGGELALLLATLTGPLSLAAFAIAALVFPTGWPPSPRWAPVLVAAVALLVMRTVAQAFAPTPLQLPYALVAPPTGSVDELPTIPNPGAISGAPGDALASLIPVIDAAAIPFVALCGFGLVVRFVRSRGIERLQLKWFVYPTSMWFVFFAIAGILHSGTISGVFWVLSLVFEALIPVGVGIAILRYRLYDIDILINRTLVYGATTATLVAAYAMTALVAQTLLHPFTQGSEFAVAASTLVVAALIQPVRRQIQFEVDRRFYRSRYDAVRTVDALALRIRDQVDLDALRRELVDVVRDTMHPRHASVWLRKRAS